MRWRMTLWLIAMLVAATSAGLVGETGDDIINANGNENPVGESESDNTKEADDTEEADSTKEADDTEEADSTKEADNTNESDKTKENGGSDGETDEGVDPAPTPETPDTTTTEADNTKEDGGPDDGTGENDGPTSTPETTTPGPTTEGGNNGEDVELIINTYSGKIQGFPWPRNYNIIGYFDIPYGVFDNPLQAATPAANWTETHNVREHEKHCPQLLEDNNYHEDSNCLTLSIFKPVNVTDASVLFHIHDDLITGSGDPSIYGPDYLVPNEIILVLPNYRIGSLGFLCMHNTSIGNAALKDLNLALSWIHRNIKHFGGDPNKIAVSGEGKSGALAGFLALSPMSKGKVNKVIAESGSFLSYLSLDRHPNDTARNLWDKIKENSNEESRNDISFDDLSAREIVINSNGMEFKPCLESKGDNTFMVESPFKILSPEEDETKEKEKIDISFLIGSAMFAGTHEAVSQTPYSINSLNENYERLLPDDLKFNSSQLRRNAANAVKEQYFGSQPIQLTDDIKNISLYFTDMAYLGPGIRSARLLVAAGATVYFYEFAYTGKFNRELNFLDHPVDGAVRGDIIGYLFTQDGVQPTDEELHDGEMVETLTEMWTSFLKTGSPSTGSVKWDKLAAQQHDKEEWLLIDKEPKKKTGVHIDRQTLWTIIYYYHFVDNRSYKLSPSLYVTGIQFTFWLAFCRGVNKMF